MPDDVSLLNSAETRAAARYQSEENHNPRTHVKFCSFARRVRTLKSRIRRLRADVDMAAGFDEDRGAIGDEQRGMQNMAMSEKHLFINIGETSDSSRIRPIRGK